MRLQPVKSIFAAVLCLLSVSIFAADRIAIVEPIVRGNISSKEVAGVWDILEASFQSEQYDLISRASLKSMLVEIGLSEVSELLDLNSAQRAALGKVEGVKYILVPTITKLGSQYNLLLKVVDASSGKVDQRRSANLRVKSIDDLADRLEPVLLRLCPMKKALSAHCSTRCSAARSPPISPKICAAIWRRP